MSRPLRTAPQTTPSTPEKRQSRPAAPTSTSRPTLIRAPTGLPSTPRPATRDSTTKVDKAAQPSITKRPSLTSVKTPGSPSTAVNRRTTTVGRTISTVARPSTSTNAPRLSVSTKINPTSTVRTAQGLPSTPKATSRIKDAIAAKRAEVRKAHSQGNSHVNGVSEESLDPGSIQSRSQEVDVDLGRWSTRETIQRAKSSGVLNLSSRSLKCLPNCLFEIHLGVKTLPLKLVESSDAEAPESPSRERRPERQQNSWYDSQDLEVLKARTNDIVELQPELALFGSMKTLDFHKNQLTTIPNSFATFSLLSHLDLSANKLTSLPPALFSLPSLYTLDISQNQLTTLPFSQFNIPLALADTPSLATFFDGEVRRADTPLPTLRKLNAEQNKLISESIDLSHIPANLIYLDLSRNPLGPSSNLIKALAILKNLKELHLAFAPIEDEAFLSPSSGRFPALQQLNLEETPISMQAIRTFFNGSEREKGLRFDITSSGPKPGEMFVILGKKVIKEAWEIEADSHMLRKKASRSNVDLKFESSASEISPLPIKPIEKEGWEIELENRSLPGVAQRKARAAEAALKSSSQSDNGSKGTTETEKPSQSGISEIFTLSQSTYYSEANQKLTLPPSQPRNHSRSFSLASNLKGKSSKEDLTLPMATLPLSVIAKAPFATTLKVLILRCRRADPSFNLPLEMFSSGISSDSLPNLEELDLENCSLNDTISILPEITAGRLSQIPSRKENTLQLIAKLFPLLSILTLSSNNLTTASITPDVLSALLLPSSADGVSSRKGLKILRLESNKISSLEGFEPIADMFKGNRQVDGWRLEELDVRSNDIEQLPVLMGLLPLDVFLVENNLFRVPPRKIWEREGTKGLLSWLRGRIA